MVGELDNGLIPWIWWAYDGFVHNMTEPLTDADVHQPTADALVRPHPVQVAGTPAALDYDEVAKVLRFRWSTTAPSGKRLPDGTETVIKVPASSLPDGYSVQVTGGTVTSAPDAEVLTIVADGSASSVFVKVWAKGDPEPSDTFPPSPLDKASTTTTTTAVSQTTTTLASTGPDQAPGATPVPGTSSYTG